jgi:hypothetical protein
MKSGEDYQRNPTQLYAEALKAIYRYSKWEDFSPQERLDLIVELIDATIDVGK